MTRFTEGELKVMQILWERGELKPGQIRQHFPEPIKDPALRSYLSVLLAKGHVSRRLVGKAYYYKPKTPAESVMHTMCRRLIKTFFQGSTEALVCHLIQSEKYTEEDLRQLREAAGQGKAMPRKETQ